MPAVSREGLYAGRAVQTDGDTPLVYVGTGPVPLSARLAAGVKRPNITDTGNTGN